MTNQKGTKYNSKSLLTLKNYTPEDIQKMLNSGDSKKGLAKKLEIPYKSIDQYIIANNLTYSTPSRNKNAQKVEYNNNDVVNDDPLERFKQIFAERKLRRTLKELRDG